MIYITLFTLFIAGVHSSTSECHRQFARFTGEIDWAKLAAADKVWYDTLRGTPYPRFTDCFNIRNITAIENGFAFTQDMISEGYSKPTVHHTACIRNKDGTCTFDRSNVQDFARATKDSISQSMKTNPDIMNQIDAFAAAVHRLKIIMATDYENYLALIVCSSTGWRPIVKTATKNPTKYDVVKVWNAMVDHGILNHMHVMDNCIKMSNQ